MLSGTMTRHAVKLGDSDWEEYHISTCIMMAHPAPGNLTLATLPSPFLKAVSPPIICAESLSIKMQTNCTKRDCQYCSKTD